MSFEEVEEFKKDFKSLVKKYRTLGEDLDVVKKVLDIMPDARPRFSFRIDNLGITTCVVKVKKIACKSLKGRGVNSGFRLVYAYFRKDERVMLVEIYHKSDKEIEDRKRILKYFDEDGRRH
jgi:mRNA-degrading endonuclease RelE of RelBE toxin-antitoxin system